MSESFKAPPPSPHQTKCVLYQVFKPEIYLTDCKTNDYYLEML